MDFDRFGHKVTTGDGSVTDCIHELKQRSFWERWGEKRKSSLKVDMERTKSDATRARGRLMALVTFTLGNNQVQVRLYLLYTRRT